MRKILQPYEAHIPFILQFLIDFNLQGMNFVHLKSAKSRRTPGKNSNWAIDKKLINYLDNGNL